MALHHELPIYKVTYDLFRAAIDAARQMPRDVKQLLGNKMRDECLEISLLIYEANVAIDKVPALNALLRRLKAIEIMLRVSRDNGYISTRHYADAVQFADQAGKQAMGWRKDSEKHNEPSPAA